LLLHERNYLEKLWEETSKRREHRLVVLKIAEDASSLYSRIDYKSINVSRTLKVLKGIGLIIKNSDERYILSDPLFALWIRKRVLKTQ